MPTARAQRVRRRERIAGLLTLWLVAAPAGATEPHEMTRAGKTSSDVAGRVDAAAATWRAQGRLAAAPLYREILASLPHGATRASAALPGVATVTTERIAAARAATGDRAGAMESLKTCWRVHRGDQRCRAGSMAEVLELSGDWEAASSLLDDESAGLKRPQLSLYMERVALAGRHDDGESEVRVARAAVKAWPKQAAAHEALAVALFRVAEHEQAVATLEGLIEMAPQTPGVLGLLDGILADMGRVARASDGTEAARKAILGRFRARAEADPNDLVARFVRGADDLRSGRFKTAIETMGAVRERAPNDVRPVTYQAMAHYWLGQTSQAETLALMARSRWPDEPEAHLTHARVVRLQDALAAAASLERYLALASAAGRLQFSGQAGQARIMLGQLRAGQLPPDSDRPGRVPDEPTAQSLRDPFELPPPWLFFSAAGVTLLGFSLGWLAPRRR